MSEKEGDPTMQLVEIKKHVFELGTFLYSIIEAMLPFENEIQSACHYLSAWAEKEAINSQTESFIVLIDKRIETCKKGHAKEELQRLKKKLEEQLNQYESATNGV